MPIPRLRLNDAALLVIDVQERLLPRIPDRERLIANCTVLVRMAEELRLPYLVTEQYPKGLGRTAPEVASAMRDESRRVEKTCFSGMIDVVDEALRAWGSSSVLVAGLEAPVCVLQTVLDLHAGGRQAFVCADAVSGGQLDQVPHALRRMERAGAIITGVISAMYELMGDAKHPSFVRCLELAKAVRF